jgi:MFS transporter, DHA1 family, inner membrane transport protein
MDKGKERLMLYTLAAVQFTHIMDFMIMMPLGPQLMRLFEIDPQQFGLLVSAYTITAGLSGLVSSLFIDRFDRKHALSFAYIGFALGTIACALSPTYPVLLVTRSLTGMFGGLIGAQILSIVGDAIPNERRATAMGIVMAAFSIASVFGVPFGLFLANKFSWHAPFFFLGGISAVIWFLIVMFVPGMSGHLVKKGDRGGLGEGFVRAFVNPNQRLALTFMMLIMLGQFTVVPYISPYMVSNVGFTEGQLTYIYLIGGGLTIFTSPLIGRWADRAGKLKVFTTFALIVILPLFFITHLPPVSIPLALVVTTLFFLCAGGRMIPAQAMITSTVLPRYRGSFMSISSSVQQLSAGIASYIAGSIVVKDTEGHLMNYNFVGYIAIAATIITMIVARQLRNVEVAAITILKEEEKL